MKVAPEFLPHFSSQSVAQQCLLKHHLYYDVGLRAPVKARGKHHLKFGIAIHESLEFLYKRNYAIQKGSYFDDLVEEAQRIFLDHYPESLDEEDFCKTPETGQKAIREYCDFYRNEDQNWTILSTEQSTPHYGWDEVLTRDLVIQDRLSGGVFVVDHKSPGGDKAYLSGYEGTPEKPLPSYWGQFNPNSQITHYISKTIQDYGKCSGFIINAIGFGHRKRVGKNGETPGSWRKFQRQTFTRSPEQIEDELRSTKFWNFIIEENRDNISEGGTSAFSTTSCWNCEFREACRGGYQSPRDLELLQLSYVRVCNRRPNAASRGCEKEIGHKGECE